MKKIIACTLAVFAAIFVFAQNPSDSVKVYFHISQWQFDPALDGNAGSMEKFIEQVRLAAEAQNLDRIVIRGYASPEGTDRINRLLSVKRCATIASILEERAGVSPDIIESIPEGVVWGELRRAVAANPAVPSRAKILDILDHTPQWVFDSAGNIISGRKKQLMDLRGGRPWRWMLQHIFPQLRNSVAVSFYLKEIAPAVDPASELVDESDSGEERYMGVVDIDAFEGAETDADTGADSEAVGGESEGFEPTSAVVMPAGVGEVDPPYQPIALKTNLLYYGALLPNLELEWLVNDRWSVALEGNLAWWGSYKRNKSYRLGLIDAEVRRWINPRGPWHGLYAGVIAGGAWYDFQHKHNGYRGEGLMTGLSVGYMWPVTSRLSLEAEIGAGYVYTRYKEYEPKDGHHLYLRTKDINYFGPIKLKFSIVWRLFDCYKPRKTGAAL